MEEKENAPAVATGAMNGTCLDNDSVIVTETTASTNCMTLEKAKAMGADAFWKMWASMSEEESNRIPSEVMEWFSGEQQRKSRKKTPDYNSPVELIPASTIKPKPISWLLKNLLARAMITILAGVAGEGKTNFSLKIAAIVSNGGTFDGHTVAKGRVAIWSGEDSPEYSLVPRLRALGASLDNIDIIGNRTFDAGTLRPFDITVDLPLVEQTIQNCNSKGLPYSLLIVDPIMAMVLGDPHKASHVRQSLEPLRILAERQNIAVLGITHFSKGSSRSDPQDRVLGSQAFSAVARMTLGLVRNEETNIRRLVILKSNITSTNVGYDFSYEFFTDVDGCVVSRIELVGKPEGNARELMAEFEPEEPDTGAMADAIAFLKDYLQDGPASSSLINVDSGKAGHAWRTIQRASQKMKGMGQLLIEKDRGVRGKWIWSLADSKDAKTANKAKNSDT